MALPDAEEIKARINLRELFEADGHQLLRRGRSWVCISPFSKEKTPSCYVHEEEGFFKCFSSGIGGDAFTYYTAFHGISFREALERLSARAGLTGGVLPPLPVRPRPVQAEEQLTPMGDEAADRWKRAQEAMDDDEIERIAGWRGISPATIRWARDRGLMGTMIHRGARREAFLVEGACSQGQPVVPLGWHVRLGPGSPGNDGTRPTWLYEPRGIGSWPFLMGNVATASVIWCLEGQWDALAMADAMGFADRWPAECAVVGMRGASSWKRFLKLGISPSAVVFLVADADAAGRAWFEKGGFSEAMEARVRRVWGWWTRVGDGKDWNDVWKSGLMDREQLAEVFRTKLRRKSNRPKGPTFVAWCKKQASREDEIGKAARFVKSDTEKPGGRAPLKVWRRHWEKRQFPAEVVQLLISTWEAWKKEQA